MNKPKHFRTVREFRNYMAEKAAQEREMFLGTVYSIPSDCFHGARRRELIDNTKAEIDAFRATIK